MRCAVIYAEKGGYGALIAELNARKAYDVKTDQCEKYLRFYHYRKDRRDYYMFFNAGTADMRVRVNVGQKGPFKISDFLAESEYTDAGEGGWLDLDLPAGNSVVCTPGRGRKKQSAEPCAFVSEGVKVSLREGGKKEFLPYKEVAFPFDVTARSERPSFSGTARFETEVALSAKEKYLVKLNVSAGDAVLSVNGKIVGRRICKPYIFDISDRVQEGKNVIRADMSNTLSNRIGDGYSCYGVVAPLSLDGIEIGKIIQQSDK